jgi:hypothetical protein
MAFKFIKTPDDHYKNDNFNKDYTTVIYEVNNNESSWSDLLEDFRSFLTACGYVITEEDFEQANKELSGEDDDVE